MFLALSSLVNVWETGEDSPVSSFWGHFSQVVEEETLETIMNGIELTVSIIIFGLIVLFAIHLWERFNS